MEQKDLMKLTDEQVEEIAKELGDGASETTRHLREIMAEGENDNKPYPYNVENKEVTKVLANVEIDPNTGEKRFLGMVDKSEDNGITIDDILTGNDLVKLSEISDEKMIESMREDNIPDEEIMQLITLVRRHEAGEKVRFDELPNYGKRLVNGLLGATDENGRPISRDTIVSDVLHMIARSFQEDQEWIDFTEALQKEMKLPEMVDMFMEETDKQITDNFLKIADGCEESNPEKAQELRKIAEMYTDGRTFKTIEECVINNDKRTKKLGREIKRFNQYSRDFSYKYKNSKFKIDSLELAAKVLFRHLPDISEDRIKAFLILFCRIAQNMHPNNISEHAYMYYTLKTITMLDAYTKQEGGYQKTVDTLNRIMPELL